MNILYLECNMGASGDMLMAALSELTGDSDGLIRELRAIGLPGVSFDREQTVKHGITGSHISVTVHGHEEDEDHHSAGHEHGLSGHHHHPDDHHHHSEDHHHHSGDHHHGSGSLSDVLGVIGKLNVSDFVREQAAEVYSLLAGAEAAVHGVPVDLVHFHEVGALDAVADIVGVCLLMERLAPDTVIASRIHVGTGTVRCAHGVLPVPAPATAELLKGLPVTAGDIEGELCTPTGAALIRHFTSSFGNLPAMTIERIGIGMGKKDFSRPNCLRAFWGTAI
jgi:uncharacterized protein (TIGR00299 family) protein